MLTIVTSLMGTVAALIAIYNFVVPQARNKYQQWKYERHIEENGVLAC